MIENYWTKRGLDPQKIQSSLDHLRKTQIDLGGVSGPVFIPAIYIANNQLGIPFNMKRIA